MKLANAMLLHEIQTKNSRRTCGHKIRLQTDEWTDGAQFYRPFQQWLGPIATPSGHIKTGNGGTLSR